MREWTKSMDNNLRKTKEGIEYWGTVDRGTKYKEPESGEEKEFLTSDGEKFIGLLNGKGEPLTDGEPLHILWFSIESKYNAESTQ